MGTGGRLPASGHKVPIFGANFDTRTQRQKVFVVGLLESGGGGGSEAWCSKLSLFPFCPLRSVVDVMTAAAYTVCSEPAFSPFGSKLRRKELVISG